MFLLSAIFYQETDYCHYSADLLGSGSTQATTDSSDNGKDQPFWNALNANVENLHAVISGHGTLSSSVGRFSSELMVVLFLFGFCVV